MTIRHPEFQQAARQLFEKAAFPQHLGMTLTHIEPGLCRAELTLQPWQMQQDQFVHAGVLATLADHTAGAAAMTQVGATQTILSIEYKINFLRPAIGTSLRCEARVLRAGRTIIPVEAEVYAIAEGQEKMVAKSIVTLAVVQVPEATRQA